MTEYHKRDSHDVLLQELDTSGSGKLPVSPSPTVWSGTPTPTPPAYSVKFCGDGLTLQTKKVWCLICNNNQPSCDYMQDVREEKHVFCKIFNISVNSEQAQSYFLSKDDDILFCQPCSSNVKKLFQLDKQLSQLKLAAEQLQLKMATSIVNSFATTPCDHSGYMIKRQIYEIWFERCIHQDPSNVWDEEPEMLKSSNEDTSMMTTKKLQIDLNAMPILSPETEQRETNVSAADYSDGENNCTSSPPEDPNSEAEEIEFLYEKFAPLSSHKSKKYSKHKDIWVRKHLRKHKKGKRKLKASKSHLSSNVKRIHNEDSQKHAEKRTSMSEPLTKVAATIRVSDEKFQTKTGAPYPKFGAGNREIGIDQVATLPATTLPLIEVDLTKITSENELKETTNHVKKRGRRRHHPENLICRFCQKVSKLWQTHLVHERSHTGEKPYMCRIGDCDKSFNDAANRTKHESTHDKSRFKGEPTLQCSECDKKFHLKISLYHHKKKKHSVVLPKCYGSATCDVCGLTLNSKNALKRHKFNLHTVTEKKPWKCSVCQLTFRNEVLLGLHEITHNSKSTEEAHRCTLCTNGSCKTYSSEEMRKHLADFHPKAKMRETKPRRVLQCPECPKYYNERKYVVEHMKSVHKNADISKAIVTPRVEPGGIIITVRKRIRNKRSNIKTNKDEESEKDCDSDDHDSHSDYKDKRLPEKIVGTRTSTRKKVKVHDLKYAQVSSLSYILKSATYMPPPGCKDLRIHLKKVDDY